MKKIISIITMMIFIIVFAFASNSYAVTLDTIDVQTNKTTVRPGEEVTVTINFGKPLGSYTFDIFYDNNIFEYVSADGGTANNTTDKVRITFYDTTGGLNPRSNMSVIFRAKENITTSNPTEFNVTGEGLANADASVVYDDITIPIVKNVIVEPEYIDYTLKLEYTGDIIKGEEKEMRLSFSSSMGRYYEHARLIAEATKPDGATVKLIGIDQAQMEHDIIQSGWGDAQGYEIGGKDFLQNLNVKAIFSDNGDYTITLKLIDRDNSDSVIAEKTFNFTIAEAQIVPPVTDNNNQQTTPSNPGGTESATPENATGEEQNNEKTETPTELPKTGRNVFVSGSIILIGLLASYGYYNKRKEN